jgi:hypothetical protein
MLKHDDTALKNLEARLQIVASSRYVAESPTFWTMSESGTRFEQLKPTEQMEVLDSLVDWGLYQDQGLSDAQAGIIFSNLRDGKPPERWVEGICDGVALENQKIASFNAMVEDSRNSPSNHFFEEMDGDRRPWAELSAAAKLQYIVRDAAVSGVLFETFAEVAKETLGDVGEAAQRVVLESQKELHAIAKLLPDDGRTEPTPLVEQVKDILDYVSALETREQERRQGREKLFEGISEVLDGKPPARWLEGAKALHDILHGDQPKQQESKTHERVGREM